MDILGFDIETSFIYLVSPISYHPPKGTRARIDNYEYFFLLHFKDGRKHTVFLKDRISDWELDEKVGSGPFWNHSDNLFLQFKEAAKISRLKIERLRKEIVNEKLKQP